MVDILYGLAVIGIALLVFILIAQNSQIEYPVRQAIAIKEPFLSPAEVTSSPHLLEGVLPAKEKDVLSGLSAEGCYEKDYQNRIQLVASYKQITNNYKRGSPDSCTAPFTELVTAFYKV
jgi:hypothetical protein